MLVENFADRLKKAILIKDIKPAEIVRISETLYNNGKINKPLTKPLLSHYLKGTYEAKQDNVYTLSLILNVDEAWLMGYDVPMESTLNKNRNKAKIPILGTVKAGYNWLAEENVIGYITDRDTIKDYEKDYKEYVAQLDELYKQQEKIETNIPDTNLDTLKSFLSNDFNLVYNSLSRIEKRRIWLSVIDYIVIDKDYNMRIFFI